MVKFPFRGNSSSEARRNDVNAESRLSTLADTEPLQILHRILGPDAKLHLVGGAVREAIHSGGTSDLDLASIFPPERSSKLLEQAGIRVIATGIRHGTITALAGDKSVEITTFRRPGSTKPDDYSSSIEEDLHGRDFTINAIAFSLDSRAIIDPTGGVQDLNRNILRSVGHAADRYQEDPLRILRMIRFGPAQERNVESSTLSAAKSLAPELKTVSPERIRQELSHILLSAHAGAAVRTMLTTSIIEILLPEMLPSVGFEQNDFHIHDVFEHTLWVLDRCPQEKLLRWAALFHDLGKPRSLSVGEQGRRHFYNHENFSEEIAEQVMLRLKFSNDDMAAIRALVRHHMRPLECGPAGVRRLIRDLGEQFDRWRIFKRADAPPKMSDQEFSRKLGQFNDLYDAELIRRQKAGQSSLCIRGDDLIALGMAPGPKMGVLLKQLEEMVIESPDLNERTELLKRAQELMAKVA